MWTNIPWSVSPAASVIARCAAWYSSLGIGTSTMKL
jgi:hypothetical protein